MRSYELVIGDVHARPHALEALLRAVGAVDDRGRRASGWWVVQVGDLLDRRVAPETNLATARVAQQLVDVVLAGNHERSMLGDRGCPHGAALAALAVHGWPQAAAANGDWLITHAGVHPSLAAGLPGEADDAAVEVNDRWNRRGPERDEDPLLSWVGPCRGGRDPFGGIFWLHTAEWPRDEAAPWGQIAGHVPQRKPRLLPGRRWAIDVTRREERLGGLVRERGADRWRPIVVSATRRSVRTDPRTAQPI